ncbi:MAG: IS701 family transposase, partial [Roseiarcus sp.]
MSSILGHADRIAPFRSYCTGLILPGERKSVEPIAARVEPGRVQAPHQSLHHFVAKAEWSDEAMLRQVRAHVLPMIEKLGAIKAWIIDDTGFPKQGVHSVGVTRQYCGQLGKQDNCQVAVSLSVANDHASLPIAFRLYLPEDWAEDSGRRSKAGVPTVGSDLTCETSKPTKWVMLKLRWCESPGDAARIAALSNDQAPTAITRCPHMTSRAQARRTSNIRSISAAVAGKRSGPFEASMAQKREGVMESATFRQWLSERGCSFDAGKD